MRRFALPLASFVVVLSLGSVSQGCATAQPPIIRVQENALEKSVFVGEWYYRPTVIDTPYSAGFTFVGEQGELQKVRWEIQRDYLIARRSYESIAGSETPADGTIAGAGSFTGAAIAKFRIESHFDIRREYNPVTGEEMNVVVENTTDRRWWERRFFRVDWSENLVEDGDFLALSRLFDGVQVRADENYVQQPDDHLAPKFERGTAGDVNYMDIVSRFIVSPSQVDIDGLGQLPSCLLLYQDHLDCSEAKILVRHSFLKVDPSRDYQPFQYTGDRMERFGYFITERPGYDPHYGIVEPARTRFANRHNLWAQSHVRGADGQLVSCASNADCDGSRGSVCDLDLARAERTPRGACTIPFRDRAVRPVSYFLSGNFPADLEPDAQHFAAEWNSAFVDTVGSMREQECLATGGTDCATERTRPDAQQLYVLCHSPVRAEDPQSCGARGTVAEIGDLRYSMIGWVADAHLSSPLGYGPSAADPETGEVIQANAFVYGAGVETLSAFARDLVALLNGDLRNTDITSGANVQRWVERQNAAGAEQTGRTRDDHVIALDGDDVESVNRSMDFSWVQGFRGQTAGGGRSRDASEFLADFEAARDRLARTGALGRTGSQGSAALQSLRGTYVEAAMATPEMRALAASMHPELREVLQRAGSAGVLDANALEAVSPLAGTSPQRLRALDQARQRLRQANGCLVGAEFADEGLLGLAREIKRAAQRGGTVDWYGQAYTVLDAQGRIDQEAVRAMLRHPIFNAVTSHEVGHTVGLRHNFSGSYDSLNYLPRYWELRDDGNVRPRAWDPITQAEIDGRQREYQYSTVMDYGNNFVSTDSFGIGPYDRAAIKMGYGDLVEVFSNARDPSSTAYVGWIQSQGWPVPLTLDALTGGDITAYTYTEIARDVVGIDRLDQRADVPYRSLRADPQLSRVGIRDSLVDARNRPAVPFMFCSDEQADLNPDCQRYDAGADAYEAIQTVIDTYWNYYIFNAFRRERLGFSVGPYAERIQGRYFAKLQSANQIYALYRTVFADIFAGEPTFDQFWTREDGMGAWTLGVGASFNLFSRVLGAPEPGTFEAGTRGDGTMALLSAQRGGTVVDALEGRYIETTWNFDAGYYWFDQLERAGYFYDKVLALETLVDPETRFVGRDTSADIRRYQLSYYTTFAPALDGLMRGVMSDDWGNFAPRTGTNGELLYPTPEQVATGSMTGLPVDPNVSFSIQLYASVYGMALIPQTYDQSFFNKSRIFVRGGAESVALTGPVVEYVDARSGLTYVAPSYVENGVETGVGARMLLHAKALETRRSTAELRRWVDNLDIVRRLTWQLGLGG